MPKYENIFSPETMTSLKGKSADSLRQMLGNKDIIRAAMESQQLIDDLAKIEEPYRDELEMIAIQMVKDIYPVIDKYGIEIDAKLIGMNDVNASLDEEFTPEQKRRIVNGITQGAAVRGTFSFLLFREYIDDLDPTLVDKYKTLMNNVFGSYDDDNAIAMFLSMIQQSGKMGGGSSKVILNESSAPVTIIARAICFPMLVHEIIKGLYELLSLNAFTGTKQQKQDVVNNVDKLSNEPHDLKYGKFIYDALSNVFNESEYDDPRIRELFFTRVYKLPDNEFLSFIENAINGKLTSSQKNWAFGEMRNINSNFKKDDTGLEDLDELEINKPVSARIEMNPKTFIPPNNNDTLKSWIAKNNIKPYYNDKRVNGWSLKCLGFGYKDNLMDNIFEKEEGGRWYKLVSDSEMIKYNNLHKKIVEIPLQKKLQNIFDNWCGINRIKIAVYPKGIIRIITPVHHKDFKMKEAQ